MRSEWKEVQGAYWQHPRGSGSDVTRKANHPVMLVSWDDALAFCQWASQATRQTVRLLTEAKWEKAARGPVEAACPDRLYPWGNERPDKTRCNFDYNVKGTTPVGQYSPRGDSPYGCADMAGNVWEWVADWYDEIRQCGISLRLWYIIVRDDLAWFWQRIAFGQRIIG